MEGTGKKTEGALMVERAVGCEGARVRTEKFGKGQFVGSRSASKLTK